MNNSLTTHFSGHHSSSAIGTRSAWNAFAQVSWEYATCCTRIAGRFNLLEALGRSQVSTLFLDVVDVLNTSFFSRQHVTKLEFCHPYVLSSCSTFHQTRHDFRRELHNCHSTRHAAVDVLSLHGLSYQTLLDLGLVDNFLSQWSPQHVFCVFSSWFVCFCDSRVRLFQVSSFKGGREKIIFLNHFVVGQRVNQKKMIQISSVQLERPAVSGSLARLRQSKQPIGSTTDLNGPHLATSAPESRSSQKSCNKKEKSSTPYHIPCLVAVTWASSPHNHMCVYTNFVLHHNHNVHPMLFA